MKPFYFTKIGELIAVKLESRNTFIIYQVSFEEKFFLNIY